ncbi:TPA: Bro-N domain-containing protein [Haemophilus influenzae]
MTIQSQFSTFNFESNSIRTLVINNEPWFVAKDVCDTLKISNISDALLKLDDDEKATIGLTDSQAGNGAQSISIISESRIYATSW